MIPSTWVLGWSRSRTLTSLLSVGFHSIADCVLDTEPFQSVVEIPIHIHLEAKRVRNIHFSPPHLFQRPGTLLARHKLPGG